MRIPKKRKRMSRTQKKTPKPDDEEQSRLFIEKAREIGAADDNAAADKLIGQLAKKPPEPRKQ
jgi:hypothetical protein